MYLIEVLIAFFILSLTLLGLDALLLYSLHHSKSTYYAEIATHQINNLVERLSVLGNAPLSAEQLQTWEQQAHDLMPNGRGALSYDYFSNPEISIFWGKQGETICQKNQIGQSGCLRTVIENLDHL
jgi:Tfp pilus assembly protein PilV